MMHTQETFTRFLSSRELTGLSQLTLQLCLQSPNLKKKITTTLMSSPILSEEMKEYFLFTVN